MRPHLRSLKSPQSNPARQDAFVLPDGSTLKYRLYGERGNQHTWYRTQWTDRFSHALKARIKERLPLLGLWNSVSALVLLAADFDKVPPGFADFDSLYRYLDWVFTGVNMAIVARSPSGKVKVFFAVKLSEPGTMTAATAKGTLQRLLPCDLADFVDEVETGYRQAYLTAEIAKLLSAKLSSLRVHAAVEAEEQRGCGTLVTDNQPTVTAHKRELRKYSGPIPERYGFFIGNDEQSPSREAFVRVVLASRLLLTEAGFELSTTKIAEACGGRKLQPHVSRWRKQFMEMGWLTCVREAYVIGKHAKGFVGAGALREDLEAIHGPASAFKCGAPLPTSIADGHWEEELLKAAFRFLHRPDEFIPWVKTIPGHDQNKRLHKAHRALAAAIRMAAAKAKEKTAA